MSDRRLSNGKRYQGTWLGVPIHRPDEEPTPALHTGPIADGEGWYVLLGSGACLSGHPVSLKGVEHVMFGRLAFFRKGDKDLVAFWAKAEELTEKLRELRIMASGYGKERFGDLEELYADAAGTPRVKPAAPAADEGDLRVLPVRYEKNKLRFRRLDESVDMMDEEVFDDWPLDTERSLAYMLRVLTRSNLTWLRHHDLWVRMSGVRDGDRSIHEHSVLCTALRWATCYDQLQVVNIAGLEVLNACRELIEHAHSGGRGSAPRWDAADEFMGTRGAERGTIIDPKKLAHVAARQGAKAKILEAALKAEETNSAWLRRQGPEDATAAGPRGAGPPGGGRLTRAERRRASAGAEGAAPKAA